MAAAGPVLFQGSSAALQFMQKEYNPLLNPISSLVFGPYGWLQTAVFYLLGFSVVALAATLLLKIRFGFNPGAILLGLVGIGFAVIGFNPAALPGAEVSLQNIIHQSTTVAILAMFPIVCLFLALKLKKHGHSRLYAYTIATGAFALVFFLLGGSIFVSHFSWVGFYERILLLNGQIWIEVMSVQLI